MQSKKLIIGIFGRKQAGKNTLANQLASYIGERTVGVPTYIDPYGHIRHAQTHFSISVGPTPATVDVGAWGVQVISFADNLKRFCVEVLGIPERHIYGSDHDKKQLTHIQWQGMPLAARWQMAPHTWWKPLSWGRLRHGRMTAREVLQVFGTNIVRRIYQDAWTTSAMRMAMASPAAVVIIADGRFENEAMATPPYKDDLSTDPMDQDWAVMRVRMRRSPFRSGHEHVSERGLDHLPDHHFNYVFSESTTVRDQQRAIEQYFGPKIDKYIQPLVARRAAEEMRASA
jgi:hypothetical protein